MELSLLLKELSVILLGYALGCFSTGYYLVRWRTGQDLRRLGSGATGGRNVGRVLGWPGAVLTGLGDVLKGALAVWLAFYFGLSLWGAALTMVTALLGHLWPAQLGFRGGKGLSAAFGGALVFDYRFTLGVAVLALLMGALTRRFRFTAGFMLVIALAPAAAVLVGLALPGVAGVAAVAILILYAHRANIRVLFAPGARGK